MQHVEMFVSSWLLAIIFAQLLVYVDAFSSNALESRGQKVAAIDPLLTSALLQASIPSIHVGGLSIASNGIKVWRHALSRGRLPVEVDFVANDQKWPSEPLFSAVCQKMADLELSRFVLKHPEISSSVLLSLIRLTAEYMQEMRLAGEEEDGIVGQADNANGNDDYEGLAHQADSDEEHVNLNFSPEVAPLNLDEIADDISDLFIEEWGGAVVGVNILDQMFGLDHGLLEVDQNSQVGPANGFGLQDGVWKNTGWKVIPTLQSQVATMPELKNLLKALGRRPTAKESDQLQKFAPRKPQNDSCMGAQFDPTDRESVSGVTLSGSFAEMLPSEAVLLRGSRVLRRLFMAKKLEEKLLSYQMSGWTDIPSVPQIRPHYLKRLPSAPGGPIIVCLDTSWSMGGMREHLSKAVVLGCVSEAHKQGRDCQVVAFSNERGVIEAGQITPDKRGIQRLLDFLGHGFGGGTDVTGALKYAMTALDSASMAAADLLLISDGEIPDPPISADLMEELDRLKLQRGVKVHGLLVGKHESKPLSRICSETHDFLIGYDALAAVGANYGFAGSTSSSLRFSRNRMPSSSRTTWSSRRSRSLRQLGTALRARMSQYEDEMTSKRRKNEDWDDENEDYDFRGTAFDEKLKQQADDEKDSSLSLDTKGTYLDEVNRATQLLNEGARKKLELEAWNATELLDEVDSAASWSEHLSELKAAVQRVGDGLIERGEESRLVVLSMMANEHILLLGVPGTGKSVLGRRLARICNGAFFQRLLTRFTTPDELFGPLSLRSLENDEYRRCTSGFLPTASIAFLDEIFKANSAILNTLLTILNERKFDNAGGQEDCPIRCVVGASNELPESDELAALFDRFLIRKEVEPLSDDGVLRMLSMANPGASSCDGSDSESSDVIFSSDLQDVVEELSVAADAIVMDRRICELIVNLRTFLGEEHKVQISDRRLAKTARLLKISAASHGRQKVDSVDCLLLQHCMWQLPEQKKIIKEWLLGNLTPGGEVSQFRFLLENLRQEIIAAVRKTSGDVSGNYGGRKADLATIASLGEEVGKIISILRQHEEDLARHTELLTQSGNFLWADPDDAVSTTQILLPRAKASTIAVKQSLVDALALKMALSEGPGAPSAEIRLSVIDQLWDTDSVTSDVNFTDDELEMGMREAKGMYDLETFRKWKRARKRARK